MQESLRYWRGNARITWQNISGYATDSFSAILWSSVFFWVFGLVSRRCNSAFCRLSHPQVSLGFSSGCFRENSALVMCILPILFGIRCQKYASPASLQKQNLLKCFCATSSSQPAISSNVLHVCLGVTTPTQKIWKIWRKFSKVLATHVRRQTENRAQFPVSCIKRISLLVCFIMLIAPPSLPLSTNIFHLFFDRIRIFARH